MWLGGLVLALLAVACAAPTQVAAQTQISPPSPTQVNSSSPIVDRISLRVAWGGGEAVAWNGSLQLSAGQIVAYRSLGTKSRAAAVRWDERSVRIQSSQPIVYEAFDVTVQAANDGELRIRLVADDPSVAPIEVALPVSQLASEDHNQVVDERGNRLIIQRSPGDQLQLSMRRDHLVFSPGESWQLGVRPTQTKVSANAKARLTAQVISRTARKSYFKEQFELKADENGNLPAHDNIKIPIPQAEGVYELLLTVDEYRSPVRFRETAHVERTVQFVVVSNRPPKLNDNEEWREVLEFDAAQPRWWESLTRMPSWNRLPLKLKARVTDGDARPWQHRGRLVNRLQPGDRQSYPLPISKTGVPYILEVDCPADVRQELHISIVESELQTEQHIAGVAIEPNPMAGQTRDTVRLVFWPKTRLPYVMIENGNANAPALFETIRVLSGPDHLPADELHRSTVGNRQGLAYLAEPNYPEMFSASKARESASNRELTDWTTFLEGSQRFVEYLRYTGYTGAAVGAMVDGSTIFPAVALDPASRFDTGAYFNNGQDPTQKDALELLFRLFDRERLQLIPVIRLSAAIPQLERIADGMTAEDATGVRLVNHKGQPYATADGFLLYNPLDKNVQEAVARIVQQMVDRYSRHDSFGGICLELGPGTFAQLPSTDWGFDATSVRRFLQESPEVAAEIGAEAETVAIDEALIESLRNGPHRQRLILWRAAQITAHYTRLADQIANSRNDARLHLTTSNLLELQSLQNAYQPMLRSRKRPDQALLELGINFEALRQDPRIQIARPYDDRSTTDLLRQAPALELTASAETDRRFRDAAQRTAVSTTQNVNTFWTEPGGEDTEPVIRKSATIGTSVSGSGRRARLIESLAAMDVEVFFDGITHRGTAMPNQLQRQLHIFSRLPDQRFEEVSETSNAESTRSTAGPLVVRQLSRGDRTTLYAVNASAWPIQSTVTVDAAAGTRMRPLCDVCGPSSWESSEPNTESNFAWRFEMEPYDIQAIVLNSGQARVSNVATEIPVGVAPMLQSQLTQLVVRVGQLKEPEAMSAMANAGFESVSGSLGVTKIDEWEVSAAERSAVSPDSTIRRTGNHSMKISSDGPITWARSAKFEAPKTGRLAVHVWVRNQPGQPLPPLRLAIEGRLGQKPYYRYATITDAAETPAESPGSDWRPFVLHVDDLPSLELQYVQVRFDLMGPGTIWLDDVTTYGLSFTRNEHYELSRLIAAADLQLREGRVAQCAKTLQRFWPRLLSGQFAGDNRVAELPVQESASEESGSALDKIRQFVPRMRR